MTHKATAAATVKRMLGFMGEPAVFVIDASGTS
jgi:hypothetical protein